MHKNQRNRMAKKFTLGECITLVFLSILLGGQVNASNQTTSDWEVIRSKEGIQIEQRTVQGSSLKEFRGTCIIPSSVPRILAVFNDDSRVKEWMKGTIEQKVLQVMPQSDGILQKMYIYDRISLGRGVDDRDVVLLVQVRLDKVGRQVWIDFDSTFHPSQLQVSGVVRMPFLHGHWKLKPRGMGESTEVEYQVYSSPGGWIPNWIVNWAAKDVPFETLSDLRRQAQTTTYPAFEASLSKSEEYQELISL